MVTHETKKGRKVVGKPGTIAVDMGPSRFFGQVELGLSNVWMVLAVSGATREEVDQCYQLLMAAFTLSNSTLEGSSFAGHMAPPARGFTQKMESNCVPVLGR